VEQESVICCSQPTKRYAGDGKTTIAGMLTARVVPTSGQALVAGIGPVMHPALAKQAFDAAICHIPRHDRLLSALPVDRNQWSSPQSPRVTTAEMVGRRIAHRGLSVLDSREREDRYWLSRPALAIVGQRQTSVVGQGGVPCE
jgi:hypothetical protein